jgi:hypothetical protein
LPTPKRKYEYYQRVHSTSHLHFFPATLQPNSRPGRLIVEFFGSHTIRHTHGVGLLRTSDQPFAKASTNTIHIKHKRQTPTPSAEFEPAIPKIERLQTYAYGQRDRLSQPHIKSVYLAPTFLILSFHLLRL